MDAFASYKVVQAQVEAAVKAGSLEPEQAKKILSDAKREYSTQSYNRRIEAENRLIK